MEFTKGDAIASPFLVKEVVQCSDDACEEYGRCGAVER